MESIKVVKASNYYGYDITITPNRDGKKIINYKLVMENPTTGELVEGWYETVRDAKTGAFMWVAKQTYKFPDTVMETHRL